MGDVPERVRGVFDGGELSRGDATAIEVVHVQVNGVNDEGSTQATLRQVTRDQFGVLRKGRIGRKRRRIRW